MAICAVVGCGNNTNKYQSKNKENNGEVKPKFFRFPRDPKMAKIWKSKCGRKDKINLRNAYICSKHFKKDQYARNLRHELLNYCPKNARVLKDDAVPTEDLPFTSAISRRKQELIAIREERAQRRNNHAVVESLLIEHIEGDEHFEEEDNQETSEHTTSREEDLLEIILNLQSQIKSLQGEKESLRAQVLKLTHDNYVLRRKCNIE